MVDLTDELRRTYFGLSAAGGSALSRLTAQRVFCAHAEADLDPADFHTTPKVLHLLEMVREVLGRGEKALVFASFQTTLDRLEVCLAREFPASYVEIVDGRSGTRFRQDQVDAFAAHEGPGLLLLNPKAAGVGLNITAANHVIHFNPEWNPAVTDQATARAYRRKQELPVMVHHLFYEGTVEDHVRDVVERKRSLIEDVNGEIED
ncbi:helicase-related protein [Nocardioides sp. B-3]|uniref:helicase-related protein n=1 Tax=Nocardioides sp. B-3 TaxID=2895565 RepID=UPI003FA5C111